MAKKLLEEATVRRFMKIAGIQTLSENFVDTLEEDTVEEMYNEEEPGMEPAPEAEEMPEVEPEMAEPEAEGPEMDEVDMGEDDKIDLLQKLAQALGVDVEVESDEEEGMPEEPAPEAEEGMPEEPAPEAGEEEMMEEGEHMEEPAKDPAGHSLESLPLVDDADSKDPNQEPKEKEQDPTKPQGGEHMAESKEEFKRRLVEQVAKRVAARLKELK
jgi:hypothetical protein